MKNVIIILACATLLSCSSKYEKVKVGMTLTEVESLLGKANNLTSSSSSSTLNGIEISTSETTCKYDGVGVFEFINDTLVSKNK